MANFAEIADKTFRLTLLYLKNITLNLYRRLVIYGKYGGIYWQKRRLAKQFRRFGENVFAKQAAGDVNPLLQEEVKDQVAALQELQDNTASRREAISQIRQQIKGTSYRLAPPPVAEAEPKPETPAE